MSELNGLLRHVNILQGTDSHHGFSKGNTLPLVALPFGMNHWSAQTTDSSNWFFSPQHQTLQGIRCTHQPSPWMGDYGHFTVMANTGAVPHLSAWRRARSYVGEFHAHRFRAELLNDGTVIEMAPTERGAIFRFLFKNGIGRVIFEPCSGISRVQIVDDRTVTGWVSGNSGGVTEGFAHYFVARFDRPADSFLTFMGDNLWLEDQGEKLGFMAEFSGDVLMRIATSFISVEQADRNLQLELGGTFQEVADQAEVTWEAALGRITVESEDDQKLKTFYSCLYRTQLFPRIWHELKPDGSLYHRSPFSGEIHDGPLYTDNGFWDTFRTVYPLFALLQPDRLAQILQGWVNAYKEGGWFPQWASPGYRACMVGTHIDAVIADAVARGVTDFDVETAFEGMLKHAHTVGDPSGAWGRIGIEEYREKGLVSTAHHESVARSLDYAYDDWCILQVAQHLDREVNTLQSSTLTYVNLYDPSVGFMRAKNPDGSWLEPWDEFHWGNPYVEGGPWQSSWAVQHDPAGLMHLMGGETKFVRKLESLLTTPPYYTTGAYGFEIHEMTELAMGGAGQYAHSNQPVHHVLYFFNVAGQPWRTQWEVRRVMDRMYSPSRLPGDEDNGEMSAWYVLSALGIYPLTPGHGSWTLGSPLFNHASIHLLNGKTFEVSASNNSDLNVFVTEAVLNGQPLNRLWMTHQEVTSGGTLTFKMDREPNEAIVPASGRPYSQSKY